MIRQVALLAGYMSLAACAATQTVSDASPAPSGLDTWLFAETVSDLRAISCPNGVSYKPAQNIEIDVIDVPAGTPDPSQFEGLSYVGTWELTETKEGINGLSGLVALRSGSLLSVNDTGHFVWIGIDPASGVPDGIGATTPMLNAEGNRFGAKRLQDAEGLDIRDGLAFVSFEHDHRVSAYDLESCGAAAREAVVSPLPEEVAGREVPPNAGAEALAIDEIGQLKVGFEFRLAQGSPIGRLGDDGALENVEMNPQPLFYALTGLDIDAGTTAKLYRAYDPIRGARAVLSVVSNGEEIGRANIKGQMPVDNFEGVAIGQAPNGRTRIWIVSDNNFSETQRTLLMAFDLD